MARSTTSMKKKSYTRYSDAYRQEALALAERIGVAAAARELGIHSSRFISGVPRFSNNKIHRNESGHWQKKTLA